MKKVLLLVFVGFFVSVSAQKTFEVDKFYTSVGGEYVFSFVNTNTDIESTNLRFSPWFHVQMHWHYDFSQHMGAYVGLGSRNLGYTTTPTSNNIYLEGFTVYNEKTKEFELDEHYDKSDEITTVKRRAYTVGIPIGIKIGNMARDRFVFFGGEIEFPFHYKNKAWVNNKKKEREGWWFSEQTNPYLLSTFVGLQFPGGVNLKFKWYFTNFMNENYKIPKTDIKPYEDVKSQIFYFSVGMNLFNAKRAIRQIKSIDKSKRDSYNM